MTALEISALLGIHRITLRRWEHSGKLSPVPRDWKGWRVYGSKHVKEATKIMEDER